jgi:hypothetical protein
VPIDTLDNEKYTNLIAAIRIELYAASKMMSRTRLSALELYKPENVTTNSNEIRFLLLPPADSGYNFQVINYMAVIYKKNFITKLSTSISI